MAGKGKGWSFWGGVGVQLFWLNIEHGQDVQIYAVLFW